MENRDAFVYSSPLDPLDPNDPRAIAIRLIGPNKNVLELGPATGRVTRILHELGCRVVAIEIDHSVAEKVRPYCSELILGNLEQLSLSERLGERRFDVILAGDVLEHLTDPAKLLRELKGYLSESGYLVVSIPNIAHGSIRLLLLQGKFPYTDIGILDRTHLRFFTLDTILQMLGEVGFVAVDVKRVRKDPFKQPYIEGPSLDGPDLPMEIRKVIESDPEAATVQFVLKAVLADSREAQSRLLVALESQIQERDAVIIRLQAEIEQLQREKNETEDALRQRDTQLRIHEAQINDLQQKLADVAAAAREARSANEMLTFYLNRYKRTKERFLPPGSFREHLWRTFGLRMLSGETRSRQLRAKSPGAMPNPSSTGPVDTGIRIEIPQEWRNDPQHPPVVIAIPNWNRVELLRKCIESIIARTKYERYRICVYDQASTDGSGEYLQTLGEKVDIIRSDTNVGFVLANNAVIRRYPEWDVVCLNNDTEVTEGWLENLVQTATRTDNIGLVGAKLVYGDGRLQEAGSQVFRDGSARAYGKYEDQWDPKFDQLREVDYCSAACLYVKRKVLDRVGGFDERYSPAYYEDTDLAFAARAAGFKVLYEPRSTVIHHEYSTSGGTAFDRMEANRRKFVEKWSDVLKAQQRNLWEAVSVSGREKILVIGDIVPAPDRSSGGTRLCEFLRLLARHYHVVFAYTGRYGLREYIRPLEHLGITCFYPGYAKAVHSQELDLGAVLLHNEFSFVFCELFSTAERYLEMVRQHSPGSTVIVDTYDVHFLREARQAEIMGDSAVRKRAVQTKTRELNVYRRADLILTVTEDDKRVLLREVPGLKIAVVPNIHVVPEDIVPRNERHDLLFVGGFSHTPNVDAVLYFCREIFPVLHKRLPQMKVHIVGNAPPAEILALASDNLIVTGYVQHLIPYLNSALVSIAPLRYGSGMKGKIGEAMAYGLPVVTTTIGAEGMDLRNGVDAMIADTPHEFVENILRLVNDPVLWESVSSNARQRVIRAWSPDAVDAELVRLLAGDVVLIDAAVG